MKKDGDPMILERDRFIPRDTVESYTVPESFQSSACLETNSGATSKGPEVCLGYWKFNCSVTLLL